MDKIQIYITKEELDSIEYGLWMYEVPPEPLYTKIKNLKENWDIELRKENLKELKRCLSPQED